MKVLKIAGFAGAMLLIAAGPALAAHQLKPGEDPAATCKWRLYDVQYKLDSIVQKFGENSKEAARVREHFGPVLEWCWDTYKGWWDLKTSTWHTEGPPPK